MITHETIKEIFKLNYCPKHDEQNTLMTCVEYRCKYGKQYSFGGPFYCDHEYFKKEHAQHGKDIDEFIEIICARDKMNDNT